MSEAYLAGASQEIKTDRDAKKHGATDVELWLKKISRAREDEEEWRKEGGEALKVYEGDETNAVTNLYHSNVATLVPSLYNSTPIPDVRRRYGDKDAIAKDVAEITERAVSYIIDQMPFDTLMKEMTTDSVVPGRGIMRLRYSADVEGIEKTAEDMELEVVPWEKFIRGPGRSWDKVPWIAFKLDLTFDELERLGVKADRLERIGVGASSPHEADGKSRSEDDDVAQKGIYKTIEVYEVWDRTKRQTLFIAPRDKDEPLLVLDDILELPGFFPIPAPLQQVKRRSSLTPICPYTLYRKLLEEFNAISVRISSLVGQLKVRGIYDKELNVDLTAVAGLEDGEFKAAEGVKAFQKGAGATLESGIAFWPIERIITVLQQLYLQRDQLKQLIYEVTGLSDILRGASNPNETATAQQIKTQWGSLRLQDMQAEVARVARDLFRMMAHVVATQFDWQRIKKMTGIEFSVEMPPMPPDMPPEQAKKMQQNAAQQHEEQVEKLLRSQMSSFRIDIESDSTVRSDMTRNMEQMNQFLGATSQYATALGGMIQMAPEIMPAATEIFVSFARNFRLGKTAEDALEQLSQIASESAKQPKQDPAAQKAQMEMQAAQMDMERTQAKGQADQQKQQAELQMKELDLEIKELEADMVGREIKAKQKAMDLEFKHKARMADLDMMIAERRGEIDIEQAVKSAAAKDETLKIDLRGRRAASEAELRHKRMSSDVDIDGKLRKSAADRAREAEKGEAEKAKAGPKRIKIERGDDGAIIGGTVG